MSKKLTLYTGVKIEYDPPAAGFGWALGWPVEADRQTQQPMSLFIREDIHGGGVFIRVGADLLEAKTGEATVQFNNRIWTKTEEAEEIERIKTDAQD